MRKAYAYVRRMHAECERKLDRLQFAVSQITIAIFCNLWPLHFSRLVQ